MLTLVTGLGRCGTSMVMQMLQAGGAPVVGTYPAFEESEAAAIPLSADWLKSCGDRAVKVLDPHRGWRGQCAARVIWLSRDHGEQAKSQVKFLRLVGGVPTDRNTMRRFKGALRDDHVRSHRVLSTLPMIRLRFEDVLAQPNDAARKLSAYFPKLDQTKAASAVMRRDPRRAEGVDMELRQVAWSR